MKDRLLAILLPLTAVALLLLAWDRAVVWLQVPTYLLPRPADVGTALWAGYVTAFVAVGCGFAGAFARG